MAIPLSDVEARLRELEACITTTKANEYIATRATVNNSNLLAGKDINYYRCAGNCSWSASGR